MYMHSMRVDGLRYFVTAAQLFEIAFYVNCRMLVDWLAFNECSGFLSISFQHFSLCVCICIDEVQRTTTTTMTTTTKFNAKAMYISLCSWCSQLFCSCHTPLQFRFIFTRDHMLCVFRVLFK